MVSSAVFDLDVTRLTLVTADLLAQHRLAETVFRFGQGYLGVAPTPLSPEVKAAAERLMRLTVELRSQTGGWPTDLPQTPENLEPYVSEEVEELIEALRQSRRLALPPPNQPQLLSALTPDLLWGIATSGYEVMRLLEGVQARVQLPAQPGAVGILRLVPVLSWQTQEGDLSIDLATQLPPQGQPLPAEALLQLTEGDLEGSQRPVETWQQAICQQVGQRHTLLQDLLGSGCPVEALSPGYQWCIGQLRLDLHLTLEVAARLTPELPAQSAFTLDDFAQILEPADPLPAAEPELSWVEAELGLPSEAAQGQYISPPKSSYFASEETLAAWLTLTDESWIQRFLLAVAGDMFCQMLALSPADPPQAAALVQAAYGAAGAVQGADGLFKQTFVHQPMLLADLWPRLRWYWMGTHPLIMRLMGGVSVQWLDPGATWQSGTLYLQPAATLPLDSHSRWLNLATGQLLPVPPAAVPDTTVLLLSLPELGHQPLPLTALTEWVETQLALRSQTLTTCHHPIAVDLHWLDGVEPVQADLSLSWQFTLQAGG